MDVGSVPRPGSDGNLYGRGSCDMKGGIGCMTLAAEVLAQRGILLGELLVATNTDEESSGAGGLALVQHGIEADAGIVIEPTGFDGLGRVPRDELRRRHRPGATGSRRARAAGLARGRCRQRDREGAVRARRDPRAAHVLGRPHGSPARTAQLTDVLPTMISAGEWAVTYPADCRITISALYLPSQTDADGWGLEVEQQVTDWIVERTATADPWLAENPPRVDWWPNRVMSMEIPEDEPIVGVALGATEDIGRPGRLTGLDSWYDGATLTRLGGIPSVAYGPPGIDSKGQSTAHAIDEHVPVDGLVACAQGLAVAAMRFCGAELDLWV